jgi:hypothetical protein
VNRDKIEKYLSTRQSIETNKWSSDYEDHQFQKLQLEIINQFDGETAAVDYIEQHLDNNDFRRIAIKTAISDALYEKALKLCLDGEHKDTSLPGLVNGWKKSRYEIYEKMGDVQSQKTLAFELVLGGYFEYFKKLKTLYTKDEWSAVLQNILEKLVNRNRNNVYVDILIHENLKLQLLEYCRKNTDLIKSYYTHLLPEYVNDVGAIFVEYILERAVHANGRSHYKDICGLIQHYKKACGEEAAYKLRNELKEKYPKRPAFLDELSKL